ncbi:MAG: hypothetical protein HY222_01530 [Thaumarchaeota archaeon]|nr:hypothetical protein [Nitrososphaerota archaeon]MBI3641055.1 hypothetical protein [Nitrososphaerota archaeon]
MNIDSDHARKALVAFVIERALVKISKSALDQVSNTLYEEHHCYLGDCYEHPEYLAKALKDLFGKSHIIIVESIKKELINFVEHKPIEKFLKVISE